MYGPNDKNRWAYNFLKKSDDNFIEETFYLVAIDNYYGLNRCIKINAPIEELVMGRTMFDVRSIEGKNWVFEFDC